MAKISVVKVLLKAKSHEKKGEISEAQKLYQAALQAFPNNKKLQHGLLTLNKNNQSISNQSPSQEIINQLISVYDQRQFTETEEQATIFTKKYPEATIGWTILGMAQNHLGKVFEASQTFKNLTKLHPNYAYGFNNFGLTTQTQGNLDEAIEAYNKALSLKPDFADAHYNMGNALKEKSQFGEAIEAYNKALSLNPNAEIYNNMGIALKEQGKLNEAIETYNKALLIKPNYADVYNNMGNALIEQSQFDKAIEAYNKALLIKPDYADAHNNIGLALQGQNKLDEAIEAYNKALSLKPDFADAHYNMGNALKEKSQFGEAIEAYNKALSLNPNAEIYNNMGIALKEQGKLNEAIETYNKALLIKPNYADVYNNMGNALIEQSQFDKAIEAYNKALLIKPDYADAHNNIGLALQGQNKLDEAIEAYNKAISLKQDHAEAYNNIGLALQDQGKLDEAIEAHNKAIAFRPDYAEAYNNIGLALQDQGKLDEAINTYNKALSLKQNFPDANWNQSLALLSKGDFSKGWAQYEKRWERSNYTYVPFQSTKPKWEPNQDGRVLVWSEQGLGDLIMFSSIIPELYKQTKKLIVQTDERLIALYKRSFPPDIIYYRNEDKIPEEQFDYHIPIGSLPLYFRTNSQSFEKNKGPYLQANNIKADNLRSELLSDESSNLIGISWHSTNQLRGAQNRAIALKQLTHFLQLPHTKLISLQYGDVKKDIDNLFTDFGIKVHQVPEINNMKDIDGLASLITACDSIISIDNSTIHLAGALGKESKLLLPYACDWRWGRGLSTSYWYNSVELYHQTEIGNWNQVLSEL
ncbi:tetratricopeptide repeat protein [Amylibacter sp.]|nr:tetratricopeptide repeat protein [Amylibacter sp.]